MKADQIEQMAREATLKDVIVALDALQRYAFDRKAPGMFKNATGQWVKAEAAIAAVVALAQQSGQRNE